MVSHCPCLRSAAPAVGVGGRAAAEAATAAVTLAAPCESRAVVAGAAADSSTRAADGSHFAAAAAAAEALAVDGLGRSVRNAWGTGVPGRPRLAAAAADVVVVAGSAGFGVEIATRASQMHLRTAAAATAAGNVRVGGN